MKREITTVMIASDYFGVQRNILDCPGHRAFKRAYRQSKNYPRTLIQKLTFSNREPDYRWGVELNCSGLWRSTKNNNNVNMMTSTKIGDIITFVENDLWEIA